MTNNEQIRQFILTNQKGFVPTKYNIGFLQTYTACNDFNLPNDIISMTWDYLTTLYPTAESGITSANPNYVKCLHTNSGAGRFLQLAPAHLNITSFNTDMFCSFITDAVCDDRAYRNLYRGYVRDIADYFVINYNGNNEKYDIVITQPFTSKQDKSPEDEITYNEIDFNTDYANLPPLKYYPKRGVNFLYEGGVICVVVGGRNGAVVKRALQEDAEVELIKEIKSRDKNSYGVLIYKKL